MGRGGAVEVAALNVPFVPTPIPVLRRALEVAGLKEGEVYYEPGCGDGRGLVIAASVFGAKAVGVEIRRDLFEIAVRRVVESGVEDRVLLLHGNFMEFDVPDADVVFLYLLSSVNEKLRPRLEASLREGARVVSHDFAVEAWKPRRVVLVEDHGRIHRIYYYVTGESW